MGRGALLKTSFNAGELSPLLDGRSDLAKYPQGCSLLENFIVTAQGPVYKRPGTRFVEDAGPESPVLVPFIYNRTQTYILAIGSSIAVYSDRARVLDGDGDPYSFGAGIWSVPPRRADGTSRLSHTQSGDVLFVCDADGGLPLMEIKRLDNANWTISASVMVPPPVGDREEMFVNLVIDFPYKPFAWTDEITSVAAGTYICPTFDPSSTYIGKLGIIFCDTQGSGYYFPEWSSGSLIDSKRIFQHNGRFYWNSTSSDITPSGAGPTHEEGYNNTLYLYVGTGRFYFEITDWINLSTTPGVPYWVSVMKRLPNYDGDDVTINLFTEKSLGGNLFSLSRQGGPSLLKTKATHTIGGNPDNVAIWRERLWLSRNRDLIATTAGSFYDYRRTDRAGQVVADAGLWLNLLAGDLSPISWMASSERLNIGSFGGGRIIGEQNLSNAFGPTNVKVDASTSQGSIDVGPEVIGSDVIYIDASGRRARRTSMVQEDSADLNELSDHIAMQCTFVGMAYQRSPSSVVWFILSDGSLAGMTYNRTQDVASWHRHDVGGVVKSIACIPSPDGTRDDLWLVVEREVGALTKRYIEVMPDEFRAGLRAVDARHLDCSIIYDGAPADEFTGLDHLEGETVDVVADGIHIGTRVVTDGSFTLPENYSVVVAGIHNRSRLQTMRLHVGADDGVNMGKTMRISRASVRALDTVGFKIGWAFDKLERKEFKDATQNMDEAVPAQTVERNFSFPGNYDGNGYVCIEQDQPLPCTITALAIQFEVN